MALIDCKDCGSKISYQAHRCPTCDARGPDHWTIAQRLGALLGILLLLMFLVGMFR
jgi:hypothetical protein